MAPPRLITVFGGTGFLGRHVVDALRRHDVHVRVATRQPSRDSRAEVEAVEADIRDARDVMRALDGADGAVNAVSAYVEKGGVTYTAIHVDAGRLLAEACARCEVKNFVQVSGIGADPNSRSKYIRARGLGERAVQEAQPSTTIIRPSIMFGRGDALIDPLIDMIERAPAIPLPGGGKTLLQPVWVENVAEAIARIVVGEGRKARTFEFGGPDRLSLRDVLSDVETRLNRDRPVISVPFAFARAGAWAAELLPRPALTVAQIDLLELDNVTASDIPGLEALAIEPRPLSDFLSERIG